MWTVGLNLVNCFAIEYEWIRDTCWSVDMCEWWGVLQKYSGPWFKHLTLNYICEMIWADIGTSAVSVHPITAYYTLPYNVYAVVSSTHFSNSWSNRSSKFWGGTMIKITLQYHKNNQDNQVLDRDQASYKRCLNNLITVQSNKPLIKCVILTHVSN